jgi:hypothetical protein
MLLFHYNNGYANAPQCYIIRTLSVLCDMTSPLLPVAGHLTFSRRVGGFTDSTDDTNTYYVHWLSLCVFFISHQSRRETALNKQKQSFPRHIFSETKTLISTVTVFQVKVPALTNQISEPSDVIQWRLYFELWNFLVLSTIPRPIQGIYLIYQ